LTSYPEPLREDGDYPGLQRNGDLEAYSEHQSRPATHSNENMEPRTKYLNSLSPKFSSSSADSPVPTLGLSNATLMRHVVQESVTVKQIIQQMVDHQLQTVVCLRGNIVLGVLTVSQLLQMLLNPEEPVNESSPLTF